MPYSNESEIVLRISHDDAELLIDVIDNERQDIREVSQFSQPGDKEEYAKLEGLRKHIKAQQKKVRRIKRKVT